MDSQSRCSKDKRRSPIYYSLHSPTISMRSMDSRHLGGSVKDMPPPVLDNPPQVLEIDPSNSTSHQSPSTSANWDSPVFTGHGFADHSTYGPSSSMRQVHVDHSRGKARNPLLNWYIDNDGPWIPKDSISEVSDERHQRVPQDTRLQFQHGDPYSQRIPSDAGSYQYGVPTSDSGYGTRRSDGDASVFSSDGPDKDQDGQCFRSQAADFQHYPPMEERFQEHDSQLSAWPLVPEVMVCNTSSGKNFVCNICHKCVKTRSELRKHDLRHTKPFHCGYTGCTRTEGFSTSNDLDRHVKSKHPLAVLNSEPTKRYRCHVPGCKSKDKAWPRLDNFRSHLKRVHAKDFQREEDFEDFVRRAAYLETPVSGIDPDPGFSQDQPPLEESQLPLPTASARPERLPVAWSSGQHPELEPRLNHPLPSLKEDTDYPERDLLQHGLPTKYDSLPDDTIQPLATIQIPGELHHDKRASYNDIVTPVSLKLLLSDVSEGRFESGGHVHGPNALDKAEVRPAATVDAITQAIKAALIGDAVPAQNSDPSPHLSPQWTVSRRNSLTGHPCPRAPGAVESPSEADIKPGASPSPSETLIDAEARRKANEVLDTLRSLGYIVQKDPNHSTPKFNTGSVASSKSDNVVTCLKCRKFKGRPCELKKHMKRHSRPYGCTFPACNNKTFGSKNDWKRHENSQHFHLESWRCDEQKAGGGVCAKVCYRKQTFTEHLLKDHSIPDGTDIASKVQSCHIGRNSQSRFWCGFCVRLIDLKKKSTDAWAERFDHIDDHFMGRRGQKAQSIQDWVPVDSSDEAGRHGSPPLGCHSTSSHGGREDSPGSPQSRSANESSPEPADIGRSSSGAGLSYSREESKRKRPVEDVKEGPEKQRRKTSTEASYICCCQCDTSHNRKLNQNCTVCDDSHRFCDNCVEATDISLSAS